MAALVAVLAGGCDGSGEERPRPVAAPESPPAAPRYRTVLEGAVGTVSGTVRWRGAALEPIELPVHTHAEACGRTRSVQSVRVGPNGGVEGAVIVLEGVREGRLPLGGEVRFELAGCDLSPRVAATSVGATLHFQNAEQLLHNIRISNGRETWLDVGLPHRGSSTEAPALAGTHHIRDDAAHPWIESWLYVAEHPYVAVTNAEGRFQLPRVPVGSYQIRLWHPGILSAEPTSSGRPTRSAPIVLARPLSVSEAEDSTTDFELDSTSVEAAGAVAQ